jgi:hypothetical protein
MNEGAPNPEERIEATPETREEFKKIVQRILDEFGHDVAENDLENQRLVFPLGQTLVEINKSKPLQGTDFSVFPAQVVIDIPLREKGVQEDLIKTYTLYSTGEIEFKMTTWSEEAQKKKDEAWNEESEKNRAMTDDEVEQALMEIGQARAESGLAEVLGRFGGLKVTEAELRGLNFLLDKIIEILKELGAPLNSSNVSLLVPQIPV